MSRCPAARPAVRYRGTGEEKESRKLSCGGEPAAEKIVRSPVHCRRGTAPVRDGPDGELRRRMLVHQSVVLHPRPESAVESTPGDPQRSAGSERSRWPILSPKLPQARRTHAKRSLPTASNSDTPFEVSSQALPSVGALPGGYPPSLPVPATPGSSLSEPATLASNRTNPLVPKWLRSEVVRDCVVREAGSFVYSPDLFHKLQDIAASHSYTRETALALTR